MARKKKLSSQKMHNDLKLIYIFFGQLCDFLVFLNMVDFVLKFREKKIYVRGAPPLAPDTFVRFRTLRIFWDEKKCRHF